jgi:hypothetical protein
MIFSNRLKSAVSPLADKRNRKPRANDIGSHKQNNNNESTHSLYHVWIPAFAGMTHRRINARIRSKMYRAVISI